MCTYHILSYYLTLEAEEFLILHVQIQYFSNLMLQNVCEVMFMCKHSTHMFSSYHKFKVHVCVCMCVYVNAHALSLCLNDVHLQLTCLGRLHINLV